ncbi:MAG TPA: hypothetical protein VFN10_01320, partial [Thermoanaerobaculia bacterium]|nr:hypothetical protein [Thermoanaerobaculia bacterium]
MRRFALLLILCVACKPGTTPPAQKNAGPQVRATVVTIRTSVEPGKRSFTRTLVILGDKARLTNEHDAWRLFDVKQKSVTFVDDIARTHRTEPLATILKNRQTVLARPIPPQIPHVAWQQAGVHKTIQGVDAQQAVVTAGAYRRELWIGRHPAIPEELYAMIVASDAPASPLAPMMAAADRALVAMRGFPLVDHAELPFGKSEKFVVDHTVVSIAQQPVAATLLQVPGDYKDVTPKPP